MIRIKPSLFLFFFISILIIPGCRKKKEAIEGTYIGTELHYFINFLGDTGQIFERDEHIDINLIKSGKFELTKTEAPYNMTFNANRLARKQTITIKKGDLLKLNSIYTLTIKGDSLYGDFVEKGGFLSRDQHYHFAGKKQ